MMHDVSFGTRCDSGRPVSISNEWATRHALFVGSTGSGKTVSLEKFGKEVIRPKRMEDELVTALGRSGRAGPKLLHDPENVVVAINPNGDLRFTNSLIEEARTAGRPVYILSDDPLVDGSTFLPFQKINLGTPEGRALFAECLGFVHNTGAYGASYFAAKGTQWVRAWGPLVWNAYGPSATFKTGCEFLTAADRVVRAKDSLEPRLLVEQLAEQAVFDAQEGGPSVLVDRCFEERAVVIVSFNSLFNQFAITAALFILWNFVAGACGRYDRGEKPIHLWLLLDELNELMSNVLARLICQARKFSISLIGACQHFETNGKFDLDMRTVLMSNVGTTLFFTAQHEIIDTILDYSKDTRKLLDSSSIKPFGLAPSRTEREFVDRQLERNEILDASNKPFEAIAVIRDGNPDHREPFRIEIEPPCDKETADRRARTRLPQKTVEHQPVAISASRRMTTPKKHQAALKQLYELVEGETAA